MVFKSALDSWGAAWNPGVVAIYPAILAAEFAVYISTFQFYNPYFLLKLIWPLAGRRWGEGGRACCAAARPWGTTPQ
jgi:hypothetical protein